MKTKTLFRAVSPISLLACVLACSPEPSGGDDYIFSSGGGSGLSGAAGGGPATGGSLNGASGGGFSTGGTVGATGGGTGLGTGGAWSGSTGGDGSVAGGGGVASGGGGSMEMQFVENNGLDCEVMAGEMKKNDKLPDPFMMNDGTRISSTSQWSCRRNEVKKDIEKYEVGPKPEPPMVDASVSGGNLEVKVTTSAGSITLTSKIGMATGAGPHCVAIGMNGNAGLISGCVQVPFMHDQVVTYANGGGSHNTGDPYYKVYPDLAGKIGKYSAWSWGISRLIDGLEQVKDELNIDITKIGVQGCSYAGKMALFGGAFDERVALTIAQESGGGGINAWRTSQNFTTRTGTNIEKIDNTNFSWFLGSMKNLDPYSLPHDHHELVAMIAPRAVIVLGNRDYEWLGDESGWKAVNAAIEVWKAMGLEDHIGYDFTTGHPHCQAADSQKTSVTKFVDKFLKGGTGDTMVRVDPPAQGFQLDIAGDIDWATPTLN